MLKHGSGVILTLSTPGARMTGQRFLGNGVSSAAIEAFSRILAGELGANGIRVVCLRPHAIHEAVATSHTREVFSGFAQRAGTTVEAMLAEMARTGTLLKRLPTLAEVANFAAFVASDRASAMTGAIANLTCGSLVEVFTSCYISFVSPAAYPSWFPSIGPRSIGKRENCVLHRRCD